MNSPAITLQSRLRPSADSLSRELDGQQVFLQLETEAYFGLDEVGTRIWECLSSADTVGDALKTLEGEFEVEPDELHRDVLALAAELLERRLIVVE